MFGLIRVRKHERGLWFHFGDFRGVLAPGTYRFWSRLWDPTRDTVKIVNTLVSRFEHPLLDVMLADEDLRKELVVVDLRESQRALVWKDGRLEDIVGPGRFAYWSGPYAFEVEIFDTEEVLFEHPRIDAIQKFPGAVDRFLKLTVPSGSEALLFRNGELMETLTPGKYVFWKDGGEITWSGVDMRECIVDVTGQDIMSKDKVSLRLNMVVTYKVIDSEQAVTAVSEYDKAVYSDSQLALRTAVGTRTLDALLSDKEAVGSEVQEALASRTGEYGVTIRNVGLKDIILPGEMKTIMNQVIEAEKRAQANLIQRREETAAARSQANTARLLADSPILARMKELEHLESILSGASISFVLGQGDLLTQLRSMVTSQEEGPKA
jgi:regulator of protease activity HflC (stomatin/prohibitin superfamily)